MSSHSHSHPSVNPNPATRRSSIFNIIEDPGPPPPPAPHPRTPGPSGPAPPRQIAPAGRPPSQHEHSSAYPSPPLRSPAYLHPHSSISTPAQPPHSGTRTNPILVASGPSSPSPSPSPYQRYILPHPQPVPPSHPPDYPHSPIRRHARKEDPDPDPALAPFSPEDLPPNPFNSPRRRAKKTAEKRALHNEIERRRRCSLNESVLTLGRLIPSLSSIHRPSQNQILTSTLAYIQQQQQDQEIVRRELLALHRETEMLREEVNDWRRQAGRELLGEPRRGEEFWRLVGVGPGGGGGGPSRAGGSTPVTVGPVGQRREDRQRPRLVIPGEERVGRISEDSEDSDEDADAASEYLRSGGSSGRS